ncbi:hypothetical protein RIF29_39266 [Crotalaria pallida]|uniref:Receptor-like serine/threonine-protein kinase n=1 Tax=Crotalaria pallida TaxID=3830 RepID=A0AAN9E0T4_CROPI
MELQRSQVKKNLPAMFLFVLIEILLFFFHTSSAADSISKFQPLSEGKTLVSEDGSFELGFFSPASSENRYVGIWYKSIPVKTIVWVANRDKPVKGNSSTLRINSEGNLVLVNGNETVFWSVDSRKKVRNPIVQLLNSGNLVLSDESGRDREGYLWQSFDYPCDTLLPGMKLGWDLKTGLERKLSAWKNWDDPSPGDFTWGISLEGYPQTVMWKGSKVYYRGGPWNGIGFSGAPELKANPLFEYKFVSNKDEVYYTYNLRNNKSAISRIVMNQTISLRVRYTWIEETRSWNVYASVPRDSCDSYNQCGPNGYCVVSDSPVCQCLTGFKPKSKGNWDMMDWTQGCVLNEQYSCEDRSKDGFSKFSGMKYPDTSLSWVDNSMNLNQCRDECLKNCSCKAYANSDVRGGGSGCLIWFRDLRDIKQLSSGGQDLYIRMKISETAGKGVDKMKLAAIIIIVASVLMVALVLYYVSKRMKIFRAEEADNNLIVENNNEGENDDLELPFFDVATIEKATDGFSINNKLGEGGFGTVYMGILADGQEIAVKRLSQCSGQGLNEFKNEVILISKLQHRNLVKLLGCCIQGEEKMLVYEYMPNKSLDFFIFDHTKSKDLDWSKRFSIICGIARGLLYLHQDSRLRIIHRDLKASNVLLDDELNPKISDFGMARTFGGDQTEGNTNRVVGTYGYMAPEYAVHGLFSVKTDVFSFGVLLLEILTGKKNRGFSHSDNCIHLIGHAWRFWKEGKPLELIDPCMEEDSRVLSEALRCIHIGLLCVQQHPEDRPNMSSVVVMLSSDSALPQPKEPGFLIEKFSHEADSSSKQHLLSSTNEISVTMFDPRKQKHFHLSRFNIIQVIFISLPWVLTLKDTHQIIFGRGTCKHKRKQDLVGDMQTKGTTLTLHFIASSDSFGTEDFNSSFGV